ncbi:MAG: TonB-dependent receptor [Parvularcula sp.]|nr:TonB-dependent receptor [Parvularcula sp.]
MKQEARKAYLSLTTAVSALAMALPAAQAQDTGAGPADVITVTAQFREQSLQEVPTAVTAFTVSDIEDAGMKSTEDFAALTPNLTFDDSFTYLNSFVVIRGVTQINNADSPVAIIVDGVPQNNQKQFKMPLFDVQQIEVLKGPQGSLYGRNAIGGAINIVTKQPTNEFEGFIGGGVENGVGYRAQAGVSGPIVEETVLFRLSGSYYETDGLIENTYIGEDVDNVDHDYSIRGKVAIFPAENISIDLRASYNNFKAGSSYDTIVNSLLNPGFRSGNDANDILPPTSNFAGFTTGDVFDASGKFEADFGFATATYILGYTDLNEDYRADLDFSNPTQDTFGPFGELGQGQNLDVSLLSHELRFVSRDDQAFRWIIGAYYLDTERDLLTRAFIDVDNTPEQFDSGIVIIDRNEANDNTAWAIFGQAELDFTDRLTLQLGGRYDEDERKQEIPGVTGSERSATFDSFQPKATLSYDFTDAMLGYFTYSTGFRSGGFNAPGVVLPDFEDETLTNFEIGLKSQFWDQRVTFNLAGFMSESEDFQFFFVDATTASQIISNLAEVDLWGFDADFKIRASDQFTIYGGVGYTDSEIKDIGNPALEAYLTASGVNTASVIGAHSPRTTDWNINFGAQLVQPVGNSLNVVLRADYEYQGDKYWQLDNMDVRSPIHLVGLRASLEGERWSASLWTKNLLDEKYYADFNPFEYSGAPFDLAFQAKPRTYGFDVKFNY